MNDVKVTSVARRNLRMAMASPSAKLSVVLFVALLILGALFISYWLNTTQKAGQAAADGYGTTGKVPRGGVADKETVKTVESQSNAKADEAREAGKSFQAPFIFEVEQAPRLATRDGVNEVSQEVSEYSEEQVFAGLRDRAATMDRVDAEVARRGAVAQHNPNGTMASTGSGPYASATQGQGPSSQGGAPGTAQLYGLNEKDAEQISGQLRVVGTTHASYVSLPEGLLSAKAEKVATAVAVQPDKGPALINQGPKTKVVARSGDVCAAAPDGAINTDFAVPVFFELLDCGILTGTKLRGTLQKGPDNFVIMFNNFSPPKKATFKFAGTTEAISMNIDTGYAGVADDVDRHWPSRIAAAVLQNVARTERQFLQQRGQQTYWGVGGSTTTYDKPTSEERRDARIAGAVEGATDVITRDSAYAINRPATMTMERTTAIGVQFTRDILIEEQQTRGQYE